MASLPPVANGLAPLVHERVGASGVANPVTAVLLNFRGYDTLLEIAVLLLALVGASALRIAGQEDALVPGPGTVLYSFARMLVPVMLVVAGYFLWAGATAPGGAFQAAAVLAGAGLLAVLAGVARFPDLDDRRWRAAIVSGFGLFLFVAGVSLLLEGRLLQYPHAQSGMLILLIEAGLAVSLGLMLFAFFAVGRGGK
jgi:multisubunit Na+/H+ antiporter MnhB subunit